MKHSREKLTKTTLTYLLSISGLIYILTSGTNNKTRQSLHERSKGECENCNAANKNLEIAHTQHGKNHNDLNNLKMLCPRCHHLDHVNRENNSLSVGENDFAIYETWQRMSSEERKNIPEPKRPKKNNRYRR